MNIQKCAVIGCGAVGSTIAFQLVNGGLFNEIVLLDVNKKKAEGEAMDISHGIPFVQPVDIYAGDYSDLKDAYLVIVTAGANQAPGETRIDLIHKNARIFESIIPQITKYNKECILLIVANPVDVLTSLALKLSGFPPERVIGSGTVLDTARFKYKLGEQMGIDTRNVHAFIIGEHGDSELAVWSSANVSGIPLDEYCAKGGNCKGIEDREKIYEEVKNSAYEIIERKGATYYAIGVAVERIAQALVRDEHSVLTVSSLMTGQYGIEGVCLGMPVVIGENGVEKMIELPLNEEEERKLKESAETLARVLEDA